MARGRQHGPAAVAVLDVGRVRLQHQGTTVGVDGTNDAPEVVVNSPATVNEGDAGVSAPITVIISDHVTISDPDLADARLPYAGGLAFVSATGPAPSGGVAALFTLDPATGTISYDRAAFNYLATGESITATFAFDSSSGPDVLPQQITLTIKGETDAAPLPLGAMRYFGRFAGLTNDAGGEWLELSGFTFGFDPVIHTLPDGQTVVSRFLPRPVLLELGSDRITAAADEGGAARNVFHECGD